MRRSSTPCIRLLPSFLIPILLLAPAACVTRSSYVEARDERDALRQERMRLEKEVRLLTESRKTLDAERVALQSQVEDLSQARNNLERDLSRVQKSEALLTGHLREREAELAMTTREINALRGTYDSLVEELESEVAAGAIEIEQLRSGVRLNLTHDILFASGSAQLHPKGAALIERVAGDLKDAPYTVDVQGHTDAVPIRGTLAKRYPSNWELAAARASAVVKVLQSSGVPTDRLRVVSLGPFRPIDRNDTPEGRARNRRIEIRLEPLPYAPTAEATPAAPGRRDAAGAS